MRTPVLPLLHQLLRALHIPVLPPSLAATPPSLLLLILETILASRLPLPHPIRLCNTPDDELAVIKCVLGVLADDILGMDLSVVNPKKVVQGHYHEMALVVMALVLVARKKGISVRVPTPEGEEAAESDEELYGQGHNSGCWLGEEDSPSPEGLPPPILPDITSPGPISSPITGPGLDVFKLDKWNYPADLTIAEDETMDDTMDRTQMSSSPSPAPWQDIKSERRTMQLAPLSFPERHPVSVTKGTNGENRSISQTWSIDSGASGKTVLQQMLEEFGLDLEE
ncbi:hypothetical protein IAT38_006256 [Cryptococcus sp. DSM 104549]